MAGKFQGSKNMQMNANLNSQFKSRADVEFAADAWPTLTPEEATSLREKSGKNNRLISQKSKKP